MRDHRYATPMYTIPLYEEPLMSSYAECTTNLIIIHQLHTGTLNRQEQKISGVQLPARV